MFAVEELHCMPLIMDIRTFVQKAMNNTLPYIDYVINLNNGTINISVLGVVPVSYTHLAFCVKGNERIMNFLIIIQGEI